ncbi:AAA family ATPase [Parasphingorhabdus sp.]|uniref:AAA family ATPase n=1 Tax=Parasphingorhabdus sp. TaxID=2709688 RepID=UPI002F92C226
MNRAPQTIWTPADTDAASKVAEFARSAADAGMGVFVVPGTVAQTGQAKAADVRKMQTILVDLDHGDINAKRDHLARYLGEPSLEIASGGVTPEGQCKLHLYWRLSEPAVDDDIALLCRIRGDMARKVGGDLSFRSAHQPIRVAGSIYRKGGERRLVNILHHRSANEVHLEEMVEAVTAMPMLPGLNPAAQSPTSKPSLDQILTTPVRAGGEDAWTRFDGASAAIGHYVRMIHEGRLSKTEGWEAICEFNAAMLRPSWPFERLREEADRISERHYERNGPAAAGTAVRAPRSLPALSLGALLDDSGPMPDDIIAPRVLTPGGMLVVGGAPKVGKSDFLICMLVHLAAGRPFLRFIPPRPLRIFYLQAEIQYHYLRERLQAIRLDQQVLAAARDNLIVTPKLNLLLDDKGVALAIDAITRYFPDAPPDIICIDPIRNVFDGGPDGGGENDNAAMLFFLQQRVEALRDAAAPEAGLILAHHTKKLTKKQVGEDPFQALSGASSLRGFYTAGVIMHRPIESSGERRLEIELRNGPALEPMLIDKRGGQWVEVDVNNDRLVRQEIGSLLDAERVRKHDVILEILLDEAASGRLYTAAQFAEKFENQAGLGGKHTIRDRTSVLATKGYIKFVRDGGPYGLGTTTSKFGFMCTEHMAFPGTDEVADTDTGELHNNMLDVLPSHFKCPQSGGSLPVENPRVWVYPEESQ